MPLLPPPSGRPNTTFPRPDPWTEQRRRDAEHRAARRQRRRRILFPLAVLLVLGAAGGAAAVFLAAQSDEAAPTTVPPSTVLPTTVPAAEPTPASTVPPDRLVAVDEIWLLDRGDGVYDWGLNVFVPDDAATRSGVVVTARLIDVFDEVVLEVVRTLDGVNSDSPSTVAGHLVDPERAPIRLEFDVTVGSPSNDPALDSLLSTRVVERIDDELRGRIRSSAPVDVEGVSMVLAWRDDAGEITTAVVYEIERLRPGVDARFSIDLSAEDAPDGLPVDVFWAPSGEPG